MDNNDMTCGFRLKRRGISNATSETCRKTEISMPTARRVADPSAARKGSNESAGLNSTTFCIHCTFLPLTGSVSDDARSQKHLLIGTILFRIF